MRVGNKTKPSPLPSPLAKRRRRPIPISLCQSSAISSELPMDMGNETLVIQEAKRLLQRHCSRIELQSRLAKGLIHTAAGVWRMLFWENDGSLVDRWILKNRKKSSFMGYRDSNRHAGILIKQRYYSPWLSDSVSPIYKPCLMQLFSMLSNTLSFRNEEDKKRNIQQLRPNIRGI